MRFNGLEMVFEAAKIIFGSSKRTYDGIKRTEEVIDNLSEDETDITHERPLRLNVVKSDSTIE